MLSEGQGLHVFCLTLHLTCPICSCTCPPDVLTSRVWTTGPGHSVLVCLINEQLISLSAMWSDTTVCMMTRGCLHWPGEAGCWNTLTTICLLSDVSEANAEAWFPRRYTKETLWPRILEWSWTFCVYVSVQFLLWVFGSEGSTVYLLMLKGGIRMQSKAKHINSPT